ncbi:sialate O-acetylesterase [Lutimonas saemankumensis]|uniref:sialate O-acetylesterase n=1 Tax=Lutimonas saemankumensis TaxID=483016 RepID=UPI001CD6D407|nr:sialate O-acetylesterase [Lutimonas saemankumensis]MCA0932386.1 sialate O-acetylesterase [Lutimonas saemankumensis]
MKKFEFLIILLIIFFFGISTGYYKHFPFNFVYLIKSKFNSSTTPYKRNYDISLYDAKAIDITKNTGIYLTYGQSNSTNHGQIGYVVKNQVYQFFKGITYIYEDPALGGTGNSGSVWGMVGDKLINKGVHDKVIFSSCGMGSAKIEELNSGANLKYLIENFEYQMREFGRVDGILFHQGESNNNNNAGNDNYYNEFVKLLSELKKNGVDIPIYLSRVSFCGDPSSHDDELIKKQNKIIRDFENVYEGPNTDLLSDKKYRLPDRCHFSMLGYDMFSDLWVESLINNNLK